MNEREKRYFKRGAYFFVVFIFTMILCMKVYDSILLTESLSNQNTLVLSGKIEDVNHYNSFHTFSVNGVLFRTESFIDPCLDVSTQIEVGREVNVEYKVVPEWPSTKISYACVLKIDYITKRKGSRIGQNLRYSQ